MADEQFVNEVNRPENIGNDKDDPIVVIMPAYH
jgi:hypothetical protein